LTAIAVAAVLAALPATAAAQNDTLTITPQPLPAATVGQPYSVQLGVVGNGGVVPQPPYEFRIDGGDLPEGIGFSGSGLIFGTPEVPQSTTFQLSVLDAAGHSGHWGDAQITVGTGTPLDSVLVPAGNTAVADVKSVEQQVGNAEQQLNGPIAYVTRAVRCVPSTLNTLLGGGPPSC
jgi:hypothetical protein